MPFFLKEAGNSIRGEVCTIRLARTIPCDSNPAFPKGADPQLSEAVEAQMRKSVLDSLGPSCEVEEFFIAEHVSEILLRITTNGYPLKDHGEFVKGLKSLVAHLRMAVDWLFQRHGIQLRLSGQLSLGPSLVKQQLESSGKKDTLLKSLQQPLSVLLIGTVLGSVLVPYLNERSNRAKLRHEERVKIALNIVEQSQKEQLDARKAFNEMYLSFNAQAWWWHWNVKSESGLSALATPAESNKVGELARQYSDALGECTAAVAKLWDPFLKNPYDPASPGNDVLINQANDSLTKARKRRNEVALEMARIFASK